MRRGSAECRLRVGHQRREHDRGDGSGEVEATASVTCSAMRGPPRGGLVVYQYRVALSVPRTGGGHVPMWVAAGAPASGIACALEKRLVIFVLSAGTATTTIAAATISAPAMGPTLAGFFGRPCGEDAARHRRHPGHRRHLGHRRRLGRGRGRHLRRPVRRGGGHCRAGTRGDSGDARDPALPAAAGGVLLVGTAARSGDG